MPHRIMNNLAARTTTNQQDAVKAYNRQSPIKTEEYEHFCNAVGFVKNGPTGFERMDFDLMARTVFTILKTRPSWRMWDFVPSCEFVAEEFLIKSPEAFRLSYRERAELVAEAFSRDDSIVGFKMELHNVDGEPNQVSSLSLTFYKTTEVLESPSVPLSPIVSWRPRF